MLAKVAVGGIWAYQQYLSPRKGYRCAYSVLNGGTGCSGYAKHAIRDHGFFRAIPLIRSRFRACKSASHALRASCPVHGKALAHEPPDNSEAPWGQPPKRRSRWHNGCGMAACDGCATAPCAGFACASSAGAETASGATSGCPVPDCGGCDCSPGCG
ncbi:membrane protein insertion efficiency factor YidD [Oceanicola sp. D3]|uniref:membrane protein insertion efficiency factor YidD n=1 Tax=Oceanicola sp. D3 TaxID=2587163 RepID=UPI0011218E5A|nr:membrane protein insertion efficiency factor YidD [Oceanicola sp. D3]QDC08404.1 membrane protein insertion efficiency factor YidD [Oceanicola sp. D3]